MPRTSVHCHTSYLRFGITLRPPSYQLPTKRHLQDVHARGASSMQCQSSSIYFHLARAYIEGTFEFRYAFLQFRTRNTLSVPGGLVTSLCLTDAPWRALRGSVYQGLLNHTMILLLPSRMVLCLYDYRSRSRSLLIPCLGEEAWDATGGIKIAQMSD